MSGLARAPNIIGLMRDTLGLAPDRPALPFEAMTPAFSKE
jgi:hypothetical protein